MLEAEVIPVTKSSIARTWIGGLAAFAAGILVSIVGVFLMLGYAGTFTQIAGTSDYNFDPNLNGFFWVTIALIVAGGFIAVVGGVAQFVAWIGGLINSYALPEKTWFAVLLVGGVVSLAFAPVGFAAMMAYVIAAPDGTPYRQMQTPAQATLAPTA